MRSGDIIRVTAKTRISTEVPVKHCSTVTSPEFPDRYFLGVNHEPLVPQALGCVWGVKEAVTCSWGILYQWLGLDDQAFGVL